MEFEQTQFGHLQRSRKNVPNIDQNSTEIWLKKASLSSYSEGYIFAIQEEEIFSCKKRRGKQQKLEL